MGSGRRHSDWALTSAIDDIVASERYKDPSYTGFSYLSNPWYVGFPPTMSINAGSGGMAATLLSGGAGFIDIRTGASGARLSITASADVRWKIMRVE